MLKRLIAILLLLVYLPAMAGVGFSTHFCDGKVKETKVFSLSKQHCCCEEAEEEANNCCSDNIQWVKLSNDQLSTYSRTEIKALEFTPLAVSVSLVLLNISAKIPAVAGFSDASPPLPVPKKTILHCCFLI